MGEFAKWAAEMAEAEPEQERPKERDWRERASEQVERFRQTMPLSAEEGMANAQGALSELYKLLYGLGYRFRMQRHLGAPRETTQLLPEGDPGIPGRDISISLPKTASWMEPRLLSKEAVGPIQAALQNREVEARSRIKGKLGKKFAPTADPVTVPGFVPLAAITAPEAFRKGFTQADLDAAKARSEFLDAELAQAKQEFEEALGEEWRGRKAASAGEWLDSLAGNIFKLEKKAQEDQGSGMKLLNLYLGLAALLGYGSHRAAESWVSKHEPGAQKQKLYRMALRQRMYDKGVPVLVDYSSLPAAQEEDENLTDELPYLAPKEASALFKAAAGKIFGRIGRRLSARPPSIIPSPSPEKPFPYRDILDDFVRSLRYNVHHVRGARPGSREMTWRAWTRGMGEPTGEQYQRWSLIPLPLMKNLVRRARKGKLPPLPENWKPWEAVEGDIARDRAIAARSAYLRS